MTPNFQKYLEVDEAVRLAATGGDGRTTLKCPECSRTGRFIFMRVKCPGKHPARMMLAVPVSREVWE